MADKQVTSTNFRVTYHNLTEPVAVTVLGRVIGHYIPTPFGRYWEPVEESEKTSAEIHEIEEADEEIDYGRVRVLPGEECEWFPGNVPTAGPGAGALSTAVRLLSQ